MSEENIPQPAGRAKRTGFSSASVPTVDPNTRARRKFVMTVCVSVSMLIIISLYAASFRYQTVFQSLASPRWDDIKQDIAEQAAPVAQQLSGFDKLKDFFAAAVQARNAQARAIQVLKDKVSAGTPEQATSTPQAQ